MVTKHMRPFSYSMHIAGPPAVQLQSEVSFILRNILTGNQPGIFMIPANG